MLSLFIILSVREFLKGVQGGTFLRSSPLHSLYELYASLYCSL